jgi:hypothetical protein
MLSVSKQYLYLVIDQINKCVITNTNSAATANAVSNGILNSSPMVVWFPYIELNHNIIKSNSNENINYKLLRQFKTKFSNAGQSTSDSNMYEVVDQTPNGRVFDLIQMDQKLITREWIARRQLGNFRARLMIELETHCERYLARSVNFCGDEISLPYIQKQLELSNPDFNIYSPGIQEWADIVEMPVEVAYQELKMKFDSSSISVMRVHAIWSKFVNKFNNITLEDNITSAQLFERMDTHFMFGNV